MHDEIIRILIDVQHVLEIKILSHWVLIDKGLQINLVDSDQRATKGALVVMKSSRKKSLLYLQGSIVIGRDAVTSYTWGNDNDTLWLWHMRLGHIRKCILQILAK